MLPTLARPDWCRWSRVRGKSRVPDTFQLRAILPFPTPLASRRINNLRVCRTAKYFDSPRLHHLLSVHLERRRTTNFCNLLIKVIDDEIRYLMAQTFASSEVGAEMHTGGNSVLGLPSVTASRMAATRHQKLYVYFAS
jgi:hypothetical protein